MKTSQEILKQQYITAVDMQQLIPNLSYPRALKYIEELR